MEYAARVFQNEFLPDGGTEVHAVVEVTVTGDVVVPAGLRAAEVIIVDASGSMDHKGKMTAARKATATAIDCIRDGVAFGIIAGSDSGTMLYPRDDRLAVASDRARREAKAMVKRLTAGGGTAMGRWLTAAARWFGQEGDAICHALLLTDGMNEGESADELLEALGRVEGLFQCDCRGVGSDWQVMELRTIASTLLGTVEMIREPSEMAADFAAITQRSMAKRMSEVTLRISTPPGATIGFVKQIAETVDDLTDRGTQVDERTLDFPTGAWGAESRDFHVALRVPSGAVGDEMLAARVSLVVDGDVVSQSLVRAQWTDDQALSTRHRRTRRLPHRPVRAGFGYLRRLGSSTPRRRVGGDVPPRRGGPPGGCSRRRGEVAAPGGCRRHRGRFNGDGPSQAARRPGRRDGARPGVEQDHAGWADLMPTCPEGHASAAADFCEVCWGSRSGVAAPADSAASKPSFRTQMVPVATADGLPPETCPSCGTVRQSGGRFCELDGHDFEADPPQPIAAPAPATWELDVRPDREYFDQCAPEGVAFPDATPPRTFVLEEVDLVVGRRSESRNLDPEIDLACGVADPAVSRLHARFVRDDDGALSVVDEASTNGTRINGAEDPIPPGEPVPLTDGDRIHIGAWTTITVHRR